MKSPGERGKEASDGKGRAASFFRDAKPYVCAHICTLGGKDLPS